MTLRRNESPKHIYLFQLQLSLIKLLNILLSSTVYITVYDKQHEHRVSVIHSKFCEWRPFLSMSCDDVTCVMKYIETSKRRYVPMSQLLGLLMVFL